MTPTTALALTATTCFAVGAAALGRVLAAAPVAERPTLGRRGVMRARALSTPFVLLEPPMRWCAGTLRHWPLVGARERLGRLALHAGHHLGLDADDCLGLCVVSTACFGVVGCGFATTTDLPLRWVAAAMLVGSALPVLSLAERARLRARQVARALPSAIDLAALCMGAGLDFAGALALVTKEAPRAEDQTPHDALAEELRLVRTALAMGHTRREALAAFAERVPIDAVRDFVAAVVQAEAKGTPLAETLEAQATLLRIRRSAAGEEAAARASVLLALPLLLLLAAILLVMLGPFFVGSTGLP